MIDGCRITSQNTYVKAISKITTQPTSVLWWPKVGVYKIISLKVNYYIDRTIHIYLVKTNMTSVHPYVSNGHKLNNDHINYYDLKEVSSLDFEGYPKWDCPNAQKCLL